MRTRNIVVYLGIAAVVGGGIVVATGVFPRHKAADTPSRATLAEGKSNPRTEEWLARLGEGRRFAIGVARAPENVKAFLSLALAGAPPRLTAAALYALEAAHAAHLAEARGLTDAVLANLESTNDEVLGAALNVSRSLFTSGVDTSAIEKRLLGLAPRLTKGPKRYSLLDSLAGLQSARIGDAHIALAQESLGDEAPYVRSRALRFLELHGHRASASSAPELAASVKLRFTDPDPGVRGRAAVVLATLGQGEPAVFRDMLKDPVPYVRSQACAALARANNFEYLTDILQLADSTMVARYDIRGWTTLEGEPGCESHTGSSSGYLGESAAVALLLLNHGTVKLEPIAAEDIQGSLRRNRQVLAAWVAEAGSTSK